MVPPTGTAPPHEFLRLLADPVRWQIVQILARSDRRVNELTSWLGKSQNLVSYHLRELRDAGLVSGRQSSADGRDTYYRVDLARCSTLLAAVGSELHPALGLTPSHPASHTRRARRAPRVLFLCTGNSARSQMAEALVQVRSSNTVTAHSAGSHPRTLHPNAVRVMRSRGIDISGRPTKHVGRFARMRFDHVVTLCDRVRELDLEFAGQPTVSHWSLADPSSDAGSDEASLPAFEQTADELDDRIGYFLPQLTAAHDPEEGTHVR